MVDSDDDGGSDYAEVMAATPVDIKEYANSYAFVIDMPGLKTGDVRVQMKADNVLLIRSERRGVEEEGAKNVRMERRLGKFMRRFALPENANTDKITAVCRDGVLTVTVEKLPPPQPKRPNTMEVKREPLRSCGDERERKVSAVDRISVLPNELLVSILRLLSFKEATATSILSRRWRYLHTFTTKLDLDGKRCGYEELDEERRKYVRWVDGVVRLNQSSRLEEFRVVFDLTRSHTQHIDEWIRFSLSRKVESLELHLIVQGDGCRKQHDCYTLNLPPPSDKYNFSFMKKLSTYYVNVSGEAVEMLLRNCPLHEQVFVALSEDLLAIKIIKPFPSFKSLEIILCRNLTSVVVRDSNIVSVKYKGKRVNFVLVNVPLLTEVWVDGTCTCQAEDVVAMFSSVFPQLHMFKISFQCLYSPLEETREFCSELCSAVEMSNLKQLVVDIGYLTDDDDSLLPLIDLIRASPRLQRFVIEEPYEKDCVDNFVEGEPGEIPMATSADRKMSMAYPHLKEIEFVGFRGVSNQFKLLRHSVENAFALEKIVVDPWGFKLSPDISWDQIPLRKFNDKVFARAMALKECVPFGINVKIL